MVPTIHVLPEDIERAIQKNSNKCPIAVAFGRTFPDATHVSIDLSTIRATQRGKRYIWMTPRKAQQFIVAFDYGDNNIPTFSFQIRNPQITVGKPSKGESNKAKVALPPTEKATTRLTPTVTGGRTPPKARGIGSTRQFGIRGLRGNREATT